MAVVEGIHMVHNPKVAAQRLKDGKDVLTAVTPVTEPTPAPTEVIEETPVGFSMHSAKIIWGAIRIRPNISRSELMSATGYSRAMVYSTVKHLLGQDLVIATETPQGLVLSVNDAKMPDGWDVETVLADAKERMSNPDAYKLTRSKPNGSEGSMDSSLIQMLSNKKPILPQAVGAYQEFLDYIVSAPTGTKELQTIVSELVSLCKYRLMHVSIECPLCGKGKIERNGNGASCPKCKASINMGSFDASLQAMRTLAGARGNEE